MMSDEHPQEQQDETPPQEEAEDIGEQPPTPKPKRAPRKKAAPRPATPAQAPSPQALPEVVVDPNFWNELLSMQRELDRIAKNTRLANLVKFK